MGLITFLIKWISYAILFAFATFNSFIAFLSKKTFFYRAQNSFFIMLTLSLLLDLIYLIASGLYYLAELVEEYERLTRKIIKYVIWSVFIVYLFMWLFEGYPFFYILIGILSHLVYYQLLRKFPHIELTSVLFIISCIMLFVSHVVWFTHFTQYWYPFEEIFSFFLVCVWLVPFAFFISLTSDEDTLPYGNTISSTGETLSPSQSRRSGRVNRLVSFFQYIKRKVEEKLPLAEFKSSHLAVQKVF